MTELSEDIKSVRYLLKKQLDALLGCDELWSKLTPDLLDEARDEAEGGYKLSADKTIQLRHLIAIGMAYDTLIAWAKGERA
jgi:hypothetical protein